MIVGYNHVILLGHQSQDKVKFTEMAVKAVFQRKLRQLRLLMWKNWLFSVSEETRRARIYYL